MALEIRPIRMQSAMRGDGNPCQLEEGYLCKSVRMSRRLGWGVRFAFVCQIRRICTVDIPGRCLRKEYMRQFICPNQFMGSAARCRVNALRMEKQIVTLLYCQMLEL